MMEVLIVRNFEKSGRKRREKKREINKKEKKERNENKTKILYVIKLGINLTKIRRLHNVTSIISLVVRLYVYKSINHIDM